MKTTKTSVPPLGWSKNRRWPVIEALNFPAFLKTALVLGGTEFILHTGHFQFNWLFSHTNMRSRPAWEIEDLRAISRTGKILRIRDPAIWAADNDQASTIKGLGPQISAAIILFQAGKSHLTQPTIKICRQTKSIWRFKTSSSSS